MSSSQYRDRTLIATIGDEVSSLSSLSSQVVPPHQFRNSSYRPSAPSQDTITGLLLAGTGHIDGRGKKNFMVVDSSAFSFLSLPNRIVISLDPPSQDCALTVLLLDSAETSPSTIESAFAEFTERNDIAILLINQHVSCPFQSILNSRCILLMLNPNKYR